MQQIPGHKSAAEHERQRSSCSPSGEYGPEPAERITRTSIDQPSLLQTVNPAKPATTYGNDVLKLLGCKTTDDYFSHARKLGFDGEGFPEIADPNSNEYRSFRDFIARSLNTQEVTEWGW